MEQSFTLSIFTENTVGVLHRVTTIFTRRHINIESLTTSESEVPGIHRFLVVISTTQEQVDKLCKHIEKIIGVVKAFVLTEADVVRQELAMYKIATDRLGNGTLEAVIRDNHARVLVVESDYIMIEKTGYPQETIALFHLLEPFGVLGFSRSGTIAISKKPLNIKHYLPSVSR
ncbi:acetolactate synthase small subunit [Pontibacter sp. G13]|uniref:acetolactate synthase small subunit n=1 Tax=Pontibacter sp. G13 TaxID=3074898 RepID=UPI00288C5A0D|nr:acetolactate synthase small subunit [Pontibacter sp. G13]WNJ18750.1 acetolactate synthase small subunit [Pontibacter sp. G13]